MSGTTPFLSEPWALRSDYLARLVDFYSTAPDASAPPPELALASGRAVERRASIAVIPVMGMITHRASMIGSLLGGTSIEEVRSAFRSALADKSVRAIVLDVDSPGGTVSGVPEFAAEIRAARGRPGRPIIAVANTMSTSAAYWLASQADEVVATPSASIGGVGIYAVHQERSKALEAEGVTTTIISSGAHKTEANEWEPLTDEARAQLQERADTYYETFLSDVAKGRRVPVETVRERFGAGRSVMPRQAMSAGMIDGIDTLDAVLARVASVVTTTNVPVGARRMTALVELPDLEASTFTDTAAGDQDDAIVEDEGEQPKSGFDLPGRLAGVQAEMAEILAFVTVRADLRAKESRPAFNTDTEAALRTIHNGLGTLLALDEPGPRASTTGADDPPVGVPPVKVTPLAPPRPARFGAPGSWDAYLRGQSR